MHKTRNIHNPTLSAMTKFTSHIMWAGELLNAGNIVQDEVKGSVRSSASSCLEGSAELTKTSQALLLGAGRAVAWVGSAVFPGSSLLPWSGSRVGLWIQVYLSLDLGLLLTRSAVLSKFLTHF